MPSAVLKIEADTSGLARSLGDARAQAAATEKAIGGAFARAGRAATASATAATRAQQRAEAAAVRSARAQENAARRAATEAERAAQRSAMAYVRAEDQKRRASRMSAQAAARAEREATEVARQEARKRGLTAEQEARVKQQTLERLTRTYEAEERRQTAIAKRESAARARDTRRVVNENRRAERRMEGRIERGLGQAGTAVASGARTAHSQIQDARTTRAMSERVAAQAVRNAGGSETDVAATRSRMRQFVEETGMDYGAVAQALSVGQARGSSLEAQPGETRMDALNRALSIVREANAEGADPGQYLAARGRLQATGLRGASLTNAMRFSLAAAQAGQVEVDQIIQQGLPGASRLMADRAGRLTRGTGESDAAFDARRQAVMLGAFRESVATQEVLAASGGRAGYTSNTLASLQNFMSTPRRQEMALTNIRAAESQVNQATPEGRARASALRSLYQGDNALFERDPTRTGNAMRLREGVSPIEFATRVAAATGSAQAGANVFAGGGQGNAQAFLSNMRNLMAVLGGERGQAVQRMMASTGVTDETVRRHTAAVEGDSLAQLTREQEKGANALTDNTRAVVNLSNRIENFRTANPLAATGMVALGGAAASVLGAKAIGGGGATLAAAGGFFNNVRSAVTGRDLQGNEIGLGERFLRGHAATLGAIGGPAGAILSGVTGITDARNYATSSAGQDAIASLPDRLARVLSSLTLTATITPTDAAQAASRGPAPGRAR